MDAGNINTPNFKTQMRAHEANVILDALKATRGNQVRAAERLDMPLRTLVYKIAQLELQERVRALRRYHNGIRHPVVELIERRSRPA